MPASTPAMDAPSSARRPGMPGERSPRASTSPCAAANIHAALSPRARRRGRGPVARVRRVPPHTLRGDGAGALRTGRQPDRAAGRARPRRGARRPRGAAEGAFRVVSPRRWRLGPGARRSQTTGQWTGRACGLAGFGDPAAAEYAASLRHRPTRRPSALSGGAGRFRGGPYARLRRLSEPDLGRAQNCRRPPCRPGRRHRPRSCDHSADVPLPGRAAARRPVRLDRGRR